MFGSCFRTLAVILVSICSSSKCHKSRKRVKLLSDIYLCLVSLTRTGLGPILSEIRCGWWQNLKPDWARYWPGVIHDGLGHGGSRCRQRGWTASLHILTSLSILWPEGDLPREYSAEWSITSKDVRQVELPVLHILTSFSILWPEGDLPHEYSAEWAITSKDVRQAWTFES